MRTFCRVRFEMQGDVREKKSSGCGEVDRGRICCGLNAPELGRHPAEVRRDGDDRFWVRCRRILDALG
jgi:hypothetical protein